MSGRAQPENGADSPDGLADAELSGMDVWLSNLDTLLTAIRQRRMTSDQRGRYARLLQAAQRDAIERGYRGKHDRKVSRPAGAPTR
jgi:hypothetical protein